MNSLKCSYNFFWVADCWLNVLSSQFLRVVFEEIRNETVTLAEASTSKYNVLDVYTAYKSIKLCTVAW